MSGHIDWDQGLEVILPFGLRSQRLEVILRSGFGEYRIWGLRN